MEFHPTLGRAKTGSTIRLKRQPKDKDKTIKASQYINQMEGLTKEDKLMLTLPSLTCLAPLKSLVTLYINICKITFFPSTQYAYIYAIIFICKLCYKDKLGQTYLYAH